MTRQELPPQAALVKHAVGSVNTCSSTTLDQLASLLGESQLSVSVRTEKDGAQLPSNRSTAITAAKSLRPRNTRKRVVVEVVEIHEEVARSLEPTEKIRLATEIVNSSLKGLTEAIRPIARNSPGARKSQCLSSMTPSASTNTPLQPRCVNRISKRSEEKTQCRRSSSALSDQQNPGVVALAECARLAFSVLRKSTSQNGPELQMPKYQLETGMSALISKLITLGLDDLAMKELRILLRRISSTEGPSDVAPQSKKVKDRFLPGVKQTLVDLFCLAQGPRDKGCLPLLVASQLQVLKLMKSRRGSPTNIELVIEHLQLSAPYSPVNFILQMASQPTVGSQEKAARQLELLSQLLLALCPDTSSTEDNAAVDARRSISPHSALDIQLLSLKTRTMWWELSSHQPNFHSELLEPFVRYARVFARRSKLSSLEKYEKIKDAFAYFSEMMDIKSATPSHISGYTGSSAAILAELYQNLVDMAIENSRPDEAIQWCQESVALARKSGASQSHLCGVLCQLSVLKLQTDSEGTHHGDALTVVRDTIKALESDLQGDSADLDNVLIHLARLRKAAFVMIASISTTKEFGASPISSPLINKSIEIISLIPTFLIRYIGSAPDSKTSNKQFARYQQRRKLADKLIKPTIETIANLAKLPISKHDESWKRIDRALQDCVRLIIFNGAHPQDQGSLPSEEIIEDVLFLTLSNAYWCYYLREKQNLGNSAALHNVLQKSIDLINGRQLSVKESGFLPVKLEHLGSLHEVSGNQAKSLCAYQEALRTLVDLGCLRIATEEAAQQSLSSLFEKGSSSGVLGRILATYCKVASKIHDNADSINLFYDDSNLSKSERGVILEHQLTALERSLLYKDTQSTGLSALNDISTRLLNIYSTTQYPIRRLRTVVNIFRIHSTNPGILQPDLVVRLLQEREEALPDSLNADAGLERFAANLTASINVYSALLQEPSAEPILGPALGIWCNLVEESPDLATLEEKVGNLSNWLKLLQLVVDYLGMQGYEVERATALQILIAAKSLSLTSLGIELAVDLSALGQQLVRLGLSLRAGLSFQKAKQHIEATDTPTTGTVFCNLASAEYFLEIGNVVKCEEYVTSATNIITLRSSSEHSGPKTSSERLSSILIESTVTHIKSRLAAVCGQSAQALFYGRICVKLIHRAWALLEHRTRKQANIQSVNASQKSLESMSNDLTSLSISDVGPPPILSTQHQSLKSVAFWSLVPQLFYGLLNLAHILARQGLLPEALYYTQQAQTVADSVGSIPFQAQCHASLGEYKVLGGQVEDGLMQLHLAENITAKHQKTPFHVSLLEAIARASRSKSQWDKEEASLLLAQITLNDILASTLCAPRIHKLGSESDLVSRLDDLSLTKSTSKQMSFVKKGTARANQTKKRGLEGIKSDKNDSNVALVGDLLLKAIRGRILRQQAEGLVLRQDTKQASLCLLEASLLPCMPQDLLMQNIGQAQLFFCQGLETTLSDPVFSVLHESTLFYPTVISERRRRSPERVHIIKETRVKAGRLKKQHMKPSLKDVTARELTHVSDFNELLRNALEVVRTLQSKAQMTTSTPVLHTISDLSRKIFMMLSATGSLPSISYITPSFGVYIMELGRCISHFKEKSAILVEKAICAQNETGLRNAIENLGDAEGFPQESTLDLGSFQACYIDIIPASWTVISISMSEDHETLCLWKLRSGQTPFILTIPLGRHSSRDSDEDTFGFDRGKSELLDIIELANYSTHDAPDMSVKGAKTAWWDARSALDARLGDFLINMENFWLGGFRGIFAQDPPCKVLLSRFQQSFCNILERYLPSRQKRGKSSKAGHLALDVRVLELFVGLGNPNEIGEMEEVLLDLLYFVIDILQFHGERNAYDEIDFDSIAIETLDALRNYHTATLQISQEYSDNHIILILDKTLHCFPWESLPCMTGRAISRLPSLVCLRTRILQMNQQNSMHPHASDGYIVNSQHTSYVLNPSADLPSTQTTFLPSLSQLPLDVKTNSSIVGRPPSEAEIQSILSKQSLFLYFGHGSGGQYIRSRTVKKLDQCAVTLLLGCSSAKLKEEGSYEPHGMIKSYVSAGTPAVVGMLWDVTDKDCDRWGVECLSSWGLFKAESAFVGAGVIAAKNKGRRGKEKKNNEHEMEEKAERCTQKARESVSLDQAVAAGREKCFLKYLNGAAPVMYGIPVFLSR